MAVDHGRLAGALSAIVSDPPDIAAVPEQLCRACLSVLPVDGVGVSLMTGDPGGRALLGASDAVGDRVEQLQFDLGEGPCVSAFSDAAPMLVSDLQDHWARGRWPMFTHQAPSTGAAALFALPLQVGTVGIGVLDCHRRQPGPLTELAEALTVADAVTMALLNLQARLGEGTSTGGGTEGGTDAAALFDLSWRTHAVVHQATGALAVQRHISVAEALARLRAYAFRHSRPLHTVAADIMADRLDLTRDEDQ